MKATCVSGMKHQMYHLRRDHQHLHEMEHQQSQEARVESARWVRPYKLMFWTFSVLPPIQLNSGNGSHLQFPILL